MRSNGGLWRLKRNFYSLSYYCSCNLFFQRSRSHCVFKSFFEALLVTLSFECFLSKNLYDHVLLATVLQSPMTDLKHSLCFSIRQYKSSETLMRKIGLPIEIARKHTESKQQKTIQPIRLPF